MSPSSTTNVLNHPASYIPMHQLSISVSQLPDRPDQPECRDFLNTGSCKYGSDCKYHHPRDKIIPLASEYVGPLGLPLRPVSLLSATFRSLSKAWMHMCFSLNLFDYHVYMISVKLFN